MKGNRKMLLLITCNAVLWGTILYKVIAAFQTAEEEVNEYQSSVKPNFDKVKEIKQQQFVIQANYRDPFLGTLHSGKKNKRQASKTTTKKDFKALIWPNISYQGMLFSKESEETLYIISIANKIVYLKTGQIEKGVKLISGTNDEVQLQFKGKRKTVQL
jgi:hypothetical protein